MIHPKHHRKPLIISVFVSLVLFLLLGWVRNIEFLGTLWPSSFFEPGQKLAITATTLLSPSANTTPTVFILSLVFCLVAGLNVYFGLLLYKRSRMLKVSSGSKGTLGILLATLGAGCGACGAALLTPILGAVGGAALVTALPLHGQELFILALVYFIWSAYKLYWKLCLPFTCDI